MVAVTKARGKRGQVPAEGKVDGVRSRWHNGEEERRGDAGPGRQETPRRKMAHCNNA